MIIQSQCQKDEGWHDGNYVMEKLGFIRMRKGMGKRSIRRMFAGKLPRASGEDCC
jgi:hypothetical protein